MGTPMIPAAGDPFTAAGKARDKRRQRAVAALEDRYRHALMSDDERQELRDEIGLRRTRLDRSSAP
jgi:hypothetical protein